MDEPHPRKLAVILHADVVGSTGLVQQNEALAHERIQNVFHRFSETIRRYGGTAHELRGDALVADFERASDAVEAALAFQAENARFNANLKDTLKPTLRVGISLGEVVVADNTITGEGIVLAQRLEQLASGGGVCIQGAVYEAVPGRLPFDYESLGEQELKGFGEPVRAYTVSLKTGEAIPPPDVRAPPSEALSKRAKTRWSLFGTMALLIVVGGGLTWFQPWAPDEEPASMERMVFPLPSRPSVAVLPFANISDDREQEYFADGMTEDLITDLSKISGLFVIARNSSFAYKGKSVEVRQVAEDLGVRYVLEGSVRRAGEKIRVNAQLIDAISGGHVWANRFDGSINDIFAVQDEFVRKIVKALALNLSEGEEKEIARGQTNNLEAWEAFQKGWNHYLEFTPVANAKAIEHFKIAIELDPSYGRAYSALALANTRNIDWIFMGGASNRSVQSSLRAVLAYLEEASKYPTALLHVGLALGHLWFGRQQAGLDEAAQAIALDPNEPEAHIAMAWAMITGGKPESGLKFVETAIRLNPSHPSHYELPRGIALFAMGDLLGAGSVFKEALERNPDVLVFAAPLAATYAHLGLRREARAMLLLWKPGASQLELQSFPGIYRFPYKWAPEHDRVSERLSDGLRIAALPLEVTISDLIDTLRQGDAFERVSAAQSLGWFGPAAAEAVPDLVQALSDEDVRQEAAITLGKIGPGGKVAVPSLMAIQHESLVGHYVKEALRAITGE